MRIVVVYRSRYGHARSYAEWIAEDLGADLIDLAENPTPSFDGATALVLVTPIYAGGLVGAKEFKTQAERAPDAALVGVTVGASNPAVSKNLEAYGTMIAKHFPQSLRSRMRWFHLRGGLDYPKMSRLHRLMMWGVTRMAKREATKGDADAQQMIDTYGSVVDFRDRSAIAPIVEHVRGLQSDR